METNPRNDEASEHNLASARKLITFANIAGPVSILIGGVVLSAAGLICALVARSKINTLLRQSNPAQEAFREKVMSATKPGAVAIVLCSVTLALNIVSVAIAMPILLDAMQTGNVTSLVGGGTTSAGPTTSTWG